VPDVYQGTERWDLSLVDPDNRRPVDFDALGRALAELDASDAEPAELLAAWPDGRIKLFVLSRLLRLRRERPDLWRDGTYRSLDVHGRHADHVVAFARRQSPSSWAVVIVPRLTVSLAPDGSPPVGRRVWGATSVRRPNRTPVRWRNVFTEEVIEWGAGSVEVGVVLARFPFAVMLAEPSHR
jgi:(1->4)-alpha-D-glucan 1-alpha-D-glucosylmutase